MAVLFTKVGTQGERDYSGEREWQWHRLHTWSVCIWARQTSKSWGPGSDMGVSSLRRCPGPHLCQAAKGPQSVHQQLSVDRGENKKWLWNLKKWFHGKQAKKGYAQQCQSCRQTGQINNKNSPLGLAPKASDGICRATSVERVGKHVWGREESKQNAAFQEAWKWGGEI